MYSSLHHEAVRAAPSAYPEGGGGGGQGVRTPSGKSQISDQFKKIVKRYIRVGYNLDIMRQSACLVLNPITVYSYMVSSLIARRWARPQTL